jgi:hypothetical protein
MRSVQVWLRLVYRRSMWFFRGQTKALNGYLYQ